MKKFELKVNEDYKVELPKEPITNSQKSYDIISQFYEDDIAIYESFFVLLMNNGNKPIGYAKISQGGVAGTVVDIKIILKYVVDTLATGIVVAHNHPSGNMRPSSADESITKRLQTVCQAMGVKVLDHLILSPEKGEYFSFKDSGIM